MAVKGIGVEHAIHEYANAALTVGAKKKYFEGKVQPTCIMPVLGCGV